MNSYRRKLERLDENLGALDVPLTPEDVEALEGALATVSVQGDRYPEHLNRMSGR